MSQNVINRRETQSIRRQLNLINQLSNQIASNISLPEHIAAKACRIKIAAHAADKSALKMQGCGQ